MNNPSKVAVVGTGPSAFATVLALLELRKKAKNNFEIHVVTTKSLPNYDKGNEQVNAQKSRFNSTHMYAQPENNTDLTGISRAVGGFSTVWGAGIKLWSKETFAKYGLNAHDVDSAAKMLLKEMNLVGSLQLLDSDKIESDFPIHAKSYFHNSKKIKNFNLLSPTLSISFSGENACRSCGKCLSGCPYGSIWSSEKFFEDLFTANIINLHEGQLNSIKPIGNEIQMTMHSESTFSVDKVILCAGAVETSRILIRSQLVEEIDLIDSQVFYYGGLSLRKTYNNNFALSKQWVQDDKQKVMMSFYDSNQDTLTRLLNRFSFFPKFLTKYFLRIINRHMFFIIGFLNSEISGNINIKKIGNQFYIERKDNPNSIKYCKQIKKNLNRHLLRNFSFVLPYVEIPLPGYGFHIGGNEEIWRKFGLHAFNLESQQNIFVGDTSQTIGLEAGPHTFSSMIISFSKIVSSFK